MNRRWIVIDPLGARTVDASNAKDAERAAIVPGGYWQHSGAGMLIVGSGGSSLALTLYLHNKMKAGEDVPSRIVVTARTAHRLDEMRHIHAQIGLAIPID